jgi:hypothetical protein
MKFKYTIAPQTRNLKIVLKQDQVRRIINKLITDSQIKVKSR